MRKLRAWRVRFRPIADIRNRNHFIGLPVTTKLSIAPLLGVGGVAFGMKRSSVVAVLGVPQRSFKRISTSEHATDSWVEGCIQVSYVGESPVVDFVELADGPGIEVILFGLAIFNSASGSFLQALRGRAPWQESEAACSYVCQSLELGFWRSSADDQMPFGSLGVGAKGYYSDRLD